MNIIKDLIEVVSIFKLFNEVTNKVEIGHLYEKQIWKKIVWERIWSFKDTFWKLECQMQKSLDILSIVNPSPRYLTWWALSDK